MSTSKLKPITEKQNNERYDKLLHRNLHDAAERRFLSKLTALSQKYRLGISGDALLFLMEWDDDQRVYTCDGESRLFFR